MPAVAEERVVRPQAGPQEAFLATPADIAIYGGAAGGGKTWALLIEAIRHVHNPLYGGVIFRRTYPQIANEGGLWDESMSLYPLLGGEPNQTHLRWDFPWRSSVRFAHMQYEKDKLQYQGAQIPFIGWDELTHFTESQFFYMLSRNRSMSGIPGYVRATCNPDAESWVAAFIAWWIDQRETTDDGTTNPTYGLPIPERAGVIRWFVRIADVMHWADSADELRERFSELPADDVQPKSVTFIPAKLTDNPALLEADPTYRASLLAMPYVERERLLGGNWKVKAVAGTVFPRAAWTIVPGVPKGTVRMVRYWDKAGSAYDKEEAKKDHTSGCLMLWHHDTELWYITDVVRGQWKAAERERVMRNTAIMDGPEPEIWIEQEPGSGGKDSAFASVTNLRGFRVHVHKVGKTDGDKLRRADTLAAQQQIGNVCLVRPPNGGEWIPSFIAELEAFPTKGVPDDQVDSASGAFIVLSRRGEPVRGKDWHTLKR